MEFANPKFLLLHNTSSPTKIPAHLLPSSSYLLRNRSKRHLPSMSLQTVHSLVQSTATHQSVDSFPTNTNNNNVTIADSPHNGEAAAVSGLGTSNATNPSTTRDTAVVLITLTIIFFTLIVSYFLWRKHRSTNFSAASHCNRLEEYRYSRLSQNDVEVDNISFQGDLTHKTLINSVPVCAEEDAMDGDEVCPATLRLDFDSLVSISSDERGHNQNSTLASTEEDNPVNLLLNELSDEQDLLQ